MHKHCAELFACPRADLSLRVQDILGFINFYRFLKIFYTLSDTERQFVKYNDTEDDLLQAIDGTVGQGFTAGIWKKCYYRRNDK